MTVTTMPGHSFPAPEGGGSRTESLEELRQRELARRRALAEQRAGGTPAAAPTPEPAWEPDPVSAPAARPTPAMLAARPSLRQQPTAAGLPVSVEGALAFPHGFTSEESWRAALAYVAEHVGAPGPGEQRGELTQEQLWSLLGVAVLTADDPVQGLAVLRTGEKSGLPALSSRTALRADALLMDSPKLAPGWSSPLWCVYEDLHRISVIQLSAHRQKALMAVLPLPLLDDLIDEEWLTATPEPDGASRTAYLRARLAPEALGDDELSLLGWSLERDRRSAVPGEEPAPGWPDSWRLLLRLQQGDAAAVHEEWLGLPAPVRALLNELKEVSGTQQVPSRLADDRGLWQLLERLAPAGHSPSKPFRNWLMVRRMLRALRQGHNAELHGDQERARARFDAVWDLAASLNHASQQVLWEARNISAYLAAIRDRPRAAALLERDSEKRPPRQDELGLTAMEALATNRAFIDSIPVSDRVLVPNPYLALNVPDGSPDWKRAWRALYRSLGDDGTALANGARDRIEEGLRDHSGSVPRIRVPLAPQRWSDRAELSPRLALPPEPMPRWTHPPTEEERAWARRAAAREIMVSIFTPDAAGATPARPDSPESSTP